MLRIFIVTLTMTFNVVNQECIVFTQGVCMSDEMQLWRYVSASSDILA